MDVTSLTFGVKDVVAIVLAVGSAVGFVWAMKSSDDKNKASNEDTQRELDEFKKEVAEKFLHAKNSKKANIEMIYLDINKNKEELEKKETQIYARITEIRMEQKADHEKLSSKLDSLGTQMSQVNTSLAELTGYLKAKKKD